MNAESAQQQIDLRALEKAQRAETLIEQHLDECRRNNELAHTERAATRREILDSITKVHRRVDQMGGRWLAAAGAMIAVLLTVCGFLFLKAMGWN